MDWKDDDLVAVLKESKEWAACVEYLRERGADIHDQPLGAEGLVKRAIVGARRDTSLGEFTEDYRPPLSALRAIRDEIKSGVIYGSPDRCAICQGRAPVDWESPSPLHHTCIACEDLWSEANKDHGGAWCPNDVSAAILRARRLLSERTAPAVEGKTCKTCHTACFGATLGPDTGKCPQWTGEGMIPHKPTPPPPAKVTPTCWKCGKAQTSEAYGSAFTPLLGAVVKRHLCPSCSDSAVAWLAEQDRLASVARDELDRPTIKRPRVYQPRMVGTCGDWPPNRGPR